MISENRMTPIPADYDLKVAPLLGCAVTTAAGVINNDAKVKIGESVVVFGVGGVGLNVVQFAHLAGANPIVAVDIIDSKLEMAKVRAPPTHSMPPRSRIFPPRSATSSAPRVRKGGRNDRRETGDRTGL